MVFFKNWNFFHTLFLEKKGLKKMFATTLDGKEGFL